MNRKTLIGLTTFLLCLIGAYLLMDKPHFELENPSILPVTWIISFALLGTIFGLRKFVWMFFRLLARF